MRIRLSLLIGVAVCVSVTVFAQEKAQVSEHEGKVLALEAIWNRAERSKDTNALSQIFTPNMTYVDSDGSLRTRDQFLAKVKNETDPPDQLVTEEATTRSFGDCIVVTGTYHGKWTKKRESGGAARTFYGYLVKRRGQLAVWGKSDDRNRALESYINGRKKRRKQMT